MTFVISIAFVLAGWWWSGRTPAAALDQRVPWVVNRVIGTPDPPDPFMTERLFPALKFTKPLDIAFAPGSNRVFVVQHTGEIYSFPNDNAVARPDLMFNVFSIHGIEQIPHYDGVEPFGLTFDPQYQANHYCYICYHVKFPYKRAVEYAASYPENRTASRVSRFTVSSTDPPTIDAATEQLIIAWPGGGHDGGCLKFGRDGYLYISTGDSGDPNPPDPHDIGQKLDNLQAKILRIDVSHPSAGKAYSIPADNPFANTPGARGEIFAYGLRNPWRYSFDRATGELWAADVGWELWESVQRVVKGGNYGWSIMEGPQPVYPHKPRGPTPIIPPALALPHTEAASITGGYVYRGERLPALKGEYLFGDWETRRLWAAPVQGSKIGKYRTIAQTDLRIVSFGEDAEGELYIVDYEGGGIHRVVPNPAVNSPTPFPTKLSDTGLFANVTAQTPNPGVERFIINAPQWVEGSTSEHFIGVPGIDNVVDSDDGSKRIYPNNTVLARTLSLDMVAGDSTSRRKIETQLLHFDGRQWHGYAYQWNDQQNDATLVDGDGLDVPLKVADPAAEGGQRSLTWHFNSRAQCMTCHTAWTGYALAFNEPQLDCSAQFASSDGGVLSDNQVRVYRKMGLVPPVFVPKPNKDGTMPTPEPPTVLVDPYDEATAHSLDERARSYLHVNCGVCHRFGGGGTALIELRRNRSLKDTHLLSGPMLGTFNLPDAQIVCPGDPSRSVLYYRMSKSGAGRMPHLGSTTVDERGLFLLERWIASLRDVAPDASAGPQTLQAAAEQEAAIKALRSGLAGDLALAAVDKLIATPSGALKLLVAVDEGRLSPSLRLLAAQRSAGGPDTVRDLFVRFAPASVSTTPRLGANPDVDALLAMQADATNGRKVFYELSGGLCAKCHIIDGHGADFGPDLSHIAAKYSKADLLDNILHPSKTIAAGYATYIVRTRSGDAFAGFVVSKSDSEVAIKGADLKVVHLKTADIDRMAPQALSAMPEGLLADLEPQQAADLLAYLAERK